MGRGNSREGGGAHAWRPGRRADAAMAERAAARAARAHAARGTKWTRRVPRPVLIGRAASFNPPRISYRTSAHALLSIQKANG